MKRKTVEDLLPMLVTHSPALEEDLQKGAIVIFEDARIRIRTLPIA